MDAVPIVPPLFRGTKNTTLHELQTHDRSRATDTMVPAVLDGGPIGGNLPGHKKTDISVNGRNQMWIMTNDSYLSIVSKDCGPAELLVRARRAGDIEKVFPEAKVTRNTNSDYLYR